MSVIDRARGEMGYRTARALLKHEQRDIHDADQALADALGNAEAETPLVGLRAGTPAPYRGEIIKEIPGMGKVYDWRASPWTPSNGGKIRPLAFVHHIPVIPNMPGIADFVRLRDVLVAQGLMVQSATDGDGNVALFTPFDSLCYHAKGGNVVTTGCEHMHYLTSQEWSKKQLRASAWLIQLAERKHRIPTTAAQIAAGRGAIRVVKPGQTSHREVSAKAGYNDRSDPGIGYDTEYVRHCVRYFLQHEHFRGA